MRNALYILGQLDDSDVEWLAHNGVRRWLASGDIIVHEGAAIDALFITLSGQLLVTLGDGQEVARLNAGEIVGEIPSSNSAPPSATIAAVGAALVLAVPKSLLQDRLAADLPFAARFYHALAIFLADRLRSTTRRLGYVNSGDLESHQLLDNELDIGVLDTVSEAGHRFAMLLRKLAAN